MLSKLVPPFRNVCRYWRFLWSLTSNSNLRSIQLRDDLVPIQTQTEKDGDFVINGVNSREVIHRLKTLTCLPIEELERRMLPDDRMSLIKKLGGYEGSCSYHGGFIKPGESLLEIMARDNDFVLDKGYTHQQVAKPMFHVINAWLSYLRGRFLHIKLDGKQRFLCFELNGKEFISDLRIYTMFQDSPFNDGISVPGYDIILRDRKSREEFRFALLNSFLIHRYGFYEGGVPYRINPKRAIEFLFR